MGLASGSSSAAVAAAAAIASSSSSSDEEDDADPRCPPSAAPYGALQERRGAACALGALLAAGAGACIALVALPSGPSEASEVRSRLRERPSVVAVVGLGAERTGAGCSNWAELAVGPGINASDEVACALSCKSEPRCAHWNFMIPEGENNCSAPWNCLLMRHGRACEHEEDPCWSLYTRPSLPSASSRAVPVFLHGRSGVGCYRIPAIVRTAAGRLVAFSEARHTGSPEVCRDKYAQEIAVSVSDDSGRTWSEASFAVGGEHKRAFNPYPIALDSGDIVLVYGHAGRKWDGHAGSGIGIVHSANGGVTWGLERDVTRQFGAAATSQPGPGAGIAVRTQNGTDRLFVVSHRGAYEEDSITVSDDAGSTWRTLDVNFPDMDEGTIASLGGDELLLIMRHENMSTDGRAVSRSLDLGETWSPIEYNSQLPSAICQGQLLQHEGRLYFSGPLAGEGTERRFIPGGRCPRIADQARSGVCRARAAASPPSSFAKARTGAGPGPRTRWSTSP